MGGLTKIMPKGWHCRADSNEKSRTQRSWRLIAQVGGMRAARVPTCDAWLTHIAASMPVTLAVAVAPSQQLAQAGAVHMEGQQGQQAHLKESSPRPNQLLSARSAPTLWWLSLAADVMMATGVVCWPPNSLWCRYSRAWHHQQQVRESGAIHPTTSSLLTFRSHS